ncbi:MAG: ABC transporter permease [Alphaproteobacteria bacterium]|nr:ABC transporter permease [Alphaproteobacteria bacterium]
MRWLLGPSWVWLLLFVAAPAAILAGIGLLNPADTVPPLAGPIGLGGYGGLADPFYLRACLGSLAVAAVTAALCLLLGYPMALAIARSARRRLLLLLVMVPFWSGILLRLIAWIGIFRDEGLLNSALRALHLSAEPVPLLHSDATMLVGMVYCYLPFLILPLEARLATADRRLEQAAADLGAGPWQVFRRVTFPLSLPGVRAGLALVAIPVSGEYVIPELLGAAGTPLIGRVIWDEFFQSGDWPQAAALATTLLAGVLLPAALLQRRRPR